MLEMKVKAVTVNQSGDFSVLLTDIEDTKILPIVVGAPEAQNIALPLQGEVPPRPLTHDLLKSVIDAMGGKLERIIITNIRDNTYYANLIINQNGESKTVDSRPSDAIALALRCNVPIYMKNQLIEFTYDLKDIVFEE